MYTKPSKKMLAFNILDIFQKYTDANHPLSQRDIERILETEYDTKADRKSIKRNIMDLIDLGFDIDYSETIRTIRSSTDGTAEESSVLSNFYLRRDFSDAELRVLIDEVISTSYISTRYCKDLVEKLENLSSIHFKKSVSKKNLFDRPDIKHSEFFLSLELIDEAIKAHKAISFLEPKYSIDNDQAILTQKEVVVFPYETIVENNNYYLIALPLDSDSFRHYKIEIISNVNIVEKKGFEQIKPQKTVRNIEKINFQVDILYASEILEELSDKLLVSSCNKDYVLIAAKLNSEDAISFAISHADHLTVISPENIKSSVSSFLKQAVNRYA